MPSQHPPQRTPRRLSWRAERVIQMTTDLAYAAGLGLAVSAAPVAAQASSKSDTERTAMTDATQPTEGELQAELDARKQEFAESAPAELVALFEQGVLDVEALGVLDTAKKVGDEAPRFELPTATGNTFSLTSVLANGPAVVTFYRGGWCPYCNIQLRSYQQHLEQFRELGAELIAISPETPDVTADSEEAKSYDFHVLSDAGNEAADAFGIRYRLPDELIGFFEGRLDLAERNGDGSWTLPLGATYVIDAEGTIRYAFVSADYRERAEPADILAALRSIDDAD